MKIKIENGVTRYYDYEIEKAFHQYERGVSFYNYFKYKAQKFKYGEMAYYDIIKKEVEEYEQADWGYLIELRQIDISEVCEILENVEKIKETLGLLSPQQNKEQKPEQETPKTFDELFYNIELVQPSIDILKEIDPPLIDTDYNYIGKLKGIICVWIDELQRQGIVKHYSDRKIFASLIPQKIKRFSIDESMFGKYQSKAENNYRTDIKTKVSKIKLSQNSH